jgi:hypothetical protein
LGIGQGAFKAHWHSPFTIGDGRYYVVAFSRIGIIDDADEPLEVDALGLKLSLSLAWTGERFKSSAANARYLVIVFHSLESVYETLR